jgi:hemolysin D
MALESNGQAQKLADLSAQIAQKSAEGAEIEAEKSKARESASVFANKVDVYQGLQAQGYGSRLALLDAQREAGETRGELAALGERKRQSLEARIALERQRDSARSAYSAGLLDDLAKAEERAADLAHQLTQANAKVSRTELRAPVTGVVEGLSVHTIGGVVTPAQALMTIIPTENALIVEARLAGRDVGFVHAGQPAKVKVETFNFTRYGMLDGRVVAVSKDLVADGATPEEASRQKAPPAYLARIALAHSAMIIDGRRQPLQPGMTVAVDIKTGERTILDYLLSPLARKTQESLHER